VTEPCGALPRKCLFIFIYLSICRVPRRGGSMARRRPAIPFNILHGCALVAVTQPHFPVGGSKCCQNPGGGLPTNKHMLGNIYFRKGLPMPAGHEQAFVGLSGGCISLLPHQFVAPAVLPLDSTGGDHLQLHHRKAPVRVRDNRSNGRTVRVRRHSGIETNQSGGIPGSGIHRRSHRALPRHRRELGAALTTHAWLAAADLAPASSQERAPTA
jgi:hypothetical protein